MDLIQVDEVEPKPTKAPIDRAQDVAARQADLVRAGTDPAPHLGGHDDFIAGTAERGQRRPRQLFGFPFGIHVRRVDEVDPGVEGRADDGFGLRGAELPDGFEHALAAERHRAEAEFGDVDPRLAESSILHGPFFSSCRVSKCGTRARPRA